MPNSKLSERSTVTAAQALEADTLAGIFSGVVKRITVGEARVLLFAAPELDHEPTTTDDSSVGFMVGSIVLHAGALYYATDVTEGAAAWQEVLNLGGSLAPIGVSFNDNGDAYYAVPEAMTLELGSAIEGGGGTIAYAKALAANTTSFSSASGSTSFAVGDVLKVTCSSLSGYKAVTIPRSA